VSLYVAAGCATGPRASPIFRPPRRHAGIQVNGFFAMGGYAAYVWPAYAAALIALGGVTLLSLLSRAQVRKELRERGLDRRGSKS
jgi:heme exporter protein D